MVTLNEIEFELYSCYSHVPTGTAAARTAAGHGRTLMRLSAGCITRVTPCCYIGLHRGKRPRCRSADSSCIPGFHRHNYMGLELDLPVPASATRSPGTATTAATSPVAGHEDASPFRPHVLRGFLRQQGQPFAGRQMRPQAARCWPVLIAGSQGGRMAPPLRADMPGAGGKTALSPPG